MTNRLVILHVEDDADDRMFVKSAFGRVAPDILVIPACDGDEAIRYLSGDAPFADRGAYPLPQLVLLDLKLPRRSGFEVLEWTRSRPEWDRIPVVMLTSSQEERDLKQAYELGVSSYLVKSPDLKTLRQLTCGIAEYLRLIVKRPFTVSKA